MKLIRTTKGILFIRFLISAHDSKSKYVFYHSFKCHIKFILARVLYIYEQHFIFDGHPLTCMHQQVPPTATGSEKASSQCLTGSTCALNLRPTHCHCAQTPLEHLTGLLATPVDPSLGLPWIPTQSLQRGTAT